MSDGWREKADAGSPEAEAGNGGSAEEEKQDVDKDDMGTSGSKRKPVTAIRANISKLLQFSRTSSRMVGIVLT